MAVLKIKLTSIIGRMAELDNVTAVCGKSEVFHPDNALSFYSDTSQFLPLTEENPFSQPLQRMVAAAAKVKKKLRFIEDKANRPELPDAELIRYADHFSTTLEDLQVKRERTKKSIQEITRSMEDTAHFTGLDLDLDQIHACKFIKVRFGSLPRESFEKLNLYNDNPYIIFFPSSNDDANYWGVYFAPIDQVTEVDRIFSSLYFKRTRLSKFTGTPESALKELEEKRAEEVRTIQETDAKIVDFWEKEKKTCLSVYTRLTEKNIYFGIRRYAARYNDSFILTGWIPADREDEFKSSLDGLDSVECTFDGAENELIHSPPVKLQNRPVFRPFEFFVDMYGLPSYNEIDPTPFVAITYTLLFGIMFGDLGQGLAVSLIGYLMWRMKGMRLGMALIPCGISSAFFGVVFGSVFGFEHALDPFYRAVFGLPEKPVEVMEPATTNLVIYAAIGIGLFLVMTAMLINIYSCIKRGLYGNALFGPNGAAGLIFYASLVFGFGGEIVFHWKIVTAPYVICLILVPLAVMFFREPLGGLVERRDDWKPQNWGDFIMQNFFEVFEFLLSYATNTMSFLRVGAFVLVHAGMMLVVFTLAEMSGGIGYVLIVIVGNIAVMALEALLAGIQVLRLEFYEMFSRFFDGEGRPFHPVSARTET